MIVQHNMSAMNATRQLKISGGALQKNTEKLSSGYRINRAGDDAAGLSISEKMRAQIRGLDRASTNSQDGISLIQTAEGALNETHSILQRMRELAVQAASDTNTDEDRKKIQDEINQLTNEVDRIANTTEFNTKKLLNGDQKGATDGYAGTVSVDGNFVNGNVSVSVEGDVNTSISDVIRFTVKELEGTNVDKGNIRIETETLFGTESDDPNFKLSHDVAPKADGGKLTIADSKTGYTLTLELDTPSVANSYEASFKEDGTLDIKILGKNGAADKTYNLNLLTGKAIDKDGKEANNFTVNGNSISFIDGDGTSQTINVNASATDKDGKAVDGVTFSDGVADVNGTKITTGGAVTPSQGTESRLGVTTNGGALRIVDTTTGSVIDISAGTATDPNGLFTDAGEVVGKGVYKFTGTGVDLYVDTVNNKAYAAPTGGNTVSLASTATLSGNPIPSNAKLLGSDALTITQTASGASVSINVEGLKITGSDGSTKVLSGSVDFKLSVSVTNPKGDYTASINSQGQIELKDGDGKTSVIAQNGEVVSRPSSSNSSSSSSNVQTYNGTFKASGSNAKGTISFGDGYSVKVSGGKAVLIQHSVEIGSGTISNGNVSFTKLDGTKITLNAAMSGSNFKATGHKLEVQASTQSAAAANAVGAGIPASPGNAGIALANDVATPANVVNPENPNAAASKDADVEARAKTKANATEGWTDVTVKDNKITLKFGGATVTIDNADKLKVGDTVTLKITGKEDAIGADDINKDGVKLQIGANAGQEMQMRIASMKASALDIANSDGEALDVTKQSHASLAIEAYDMAIQKVSRERAKMGAIQNRLEHTIANLDTASENLQSAESRIRDTDMAKEMTAYSKNNILTQAGQSMLAQANQQTQGVLTLLR